RIKRAPEGTRFESVGGFFVSGGSVGGSVTISSGDMNAAVAKRRHPYLDERVVTAEWVVESTEDMLDGQWTQRAFFTIE
ncbi:MAG: hypothetical protein R3324_13695, partial [Halobacteriales archaeon]|nr:hypothetical protein [Halobacteriales archaeon]